MPASNYVHLDDVTILKETDKAFLIEWDDEEFWIPLSHIADPENYKEGDTKCSLSITEWIAKQKNIEIE